MRAHARLPLTFHRARSCCRWGSQCTHPPPHFSMQLCSEAPRFLSTWRSFRLLGRIMMDHKGRTSSQAASFLPACEPRRVCPCPAHGDHRTAPHCSGVANASAALGLRCGPKAERATQRGCFPDYKYQKLVLQYSTVDTWVRPVLPFNSFAWRNWLARPTVNREAVSSILTANEITFFFRRPTTDSSQGSASFPLPFNLAVTQFSPGLLLPHDVHAL